MTSEPDKTSIEPPKPMLERTAEREVASSWRTRGYQAQLVAERFATKINYGGNKPTR